MKTLALALMALAATSSYAVTVTFDEGLVAIGTVLSNQYVASKGIAFSAGSGGTTIPLSGLGTTSFATNTDGTVVSATGTDVGGLGGGPSLLSGNVLRSYAGWLNENGDPALTLTFTDAISAISIDFGGVSDMASTRIFAVGAANTIVSTTAMTSTGQGTLTLTGLSGIKKIVVTPGDYNDWVGLDNINFTPAPVPEPTSVAALGLGALALVRRRRRATA